MRITSILLLLLAAASVLPCQASAIFVASSQSGVPGQVLVYKGLLENDWGYDAFISGASLTLAGFDDSDFDLTPFLLNAPLMMQAGELTGPQDWFTVTIPASLAPGIYLGDFTIQGGQEEGADGVLNSLGFEVIVRGGAPPSEVPEPGSFWALVTAAGLLAGLKRRHHTLSC